MAASFNKVLLMGNLTRDPELRYIPSGQAVTSFTIAVNRTYAAATGEKKEEVSFLRIVVWGRRAEVCNEYLRKGSGVFVEGRLQSRSWDAPDGTKRSAVEVVAQNVQFLARAMASQGAVEGARNVASRVGEAVITDSFETPPAEGTKEAEPFGESPPEDEVPF